MRKPNPFATLIFFVILGVGGFFAFAVSSVSEVFGTGLGIAGPGNHYLVGDQGGRPVGSRGGVAARPLP